MTAQTSDICHRTVVQAALDAAQRRLEADLERLDHDFRVSSVEPIAVLWAVRERKEG